MDTDSVAACAVCGKPADPLEFTYSAPAGVGYVDIGEVPLCPGHARDFVYHAPRLVDMMREAHQKYRAARQ